MSEKKYIDTNKLLGDCEYGIEKPSNKEVVVTMSEAFAHFKELVLLFPAADVQEVKHGYWIMDWDDLWPEDSQQICSVCHGRQPMTINDDDYCPKCGAKMDAKGKEE